MANLDPGQQAGPVGSNGKPTDFTSSMAEAIEDALRTLMGQDNMNQFETGTNSNDARDRRRVLIAIAQGVVSHLVNNPDAFQITGQDSVGGNITASVTINATGLL